MDWTILDPFEGTHEWLIPYVPGHHHQFRIIHRQQRLQSWHAKKIPVTGLIEWKEYWDQSRKATQSEHCGVITLFPQLAATVALQKSLSPLKFPVIAWCFNMGRCYSGLRGELARQILSNVDRFVVHSCRERESYSAWLKLPIERFQFVPYQLPEILKTADECLDEPFILAMGSAQRDYSLLFEAVERLNLRTIVVAAPHALKGLSIPSQVEVKNGLSLKDCYRLAQQARVNVVPLIHNPEIATGPTTIVAIMRMGRAPIATRTTGSEDYILHGETGLLTAPGSVDELTDAIDRLWCDAGYRQRLGGAAGLYAEKHFSDEAAGVALGRVLDEVAEAWDSSASPVASRVF